MNDTALTDLLTGRAHEKMREWLKPGATVYTITRHKSRTGQWRVASVLAVIDGAPCDVTFQACRVLGVRLDGRYGGLPTDCTPAELVQWLSEALYPNGPAFVQRSL
jgi:hypothetical protein